MADWTQLDTNGLLPGEPVTSAKALAFFENPIALAEAATDAPKIATKNLSGSGGGTLRFGGLSTFGGARFFLTGAETSSNGSTLSINSSTPTGDGAAQSIVAVPANARFVVHGYWNKITGAWFAVWFVSSGTASGRATGTLSKGGATVDEIIFTFSNGQIYVHIMPDGGESAS